jgi:tetratricopeptide (TPR) repeat protein
VTWQQAEEKWARREADAYLAWRALDPESAAGRRARALLERADEHYLAGIERYASGDFIGAQKALAEGAKLAPIDPLHYFTLAEIYDERGLFDRAAKYYGKGIDALPKSPEAKAARDRLSALETDPLDSPTVGPESAASSRHYPAIIAVSVALLALIVFLWSRYGVGVSLSRLVDRNPELHSAVAYLIGSVRHELLKHRLGAVSDVIRGFETQRAGEAQRKFLFSRLYGGVPVHEAWQAHLSAFRGALGHKLNLNRDRAFVKAGRAIKTIARLRAPLSEKRPSSAGRLAGAHRQLALFDQYLASLQTRLVRTRVDDALLAQVVDEVRGEYALSTVALDELAIQPLSFPFLIEIQRSDLQLILRNIVRNAIIAVSRQDSNRRVGLTVAVTLEVTGEESVSIAVQDSSDEPLSAETISNRGLSTGLGLVMTAVRRYGGAMTVKPLGGRYKKEVAIRFFRVLEEEND